MASNRQTYNQLIIVRLAELIGKYPEYRFHQLLQNAGIESPLGEDRWYEESAETYANLMSSSIVKQLYSQTEENKDAPKSPVQEERK